ncbi:DUF4267 domain-containing protein [Hyphomicrobium sp. 2TAF46]|uniref:DUF4267 domain-containing protein n=1 Tax=Hyphomicrobium sp. 2TAF46 TaxID=3233019 RepID=UPI003F8F6F7A
MHSISIGLALLLALAIILIGAQYVLSPRAATRTFGLPLPEDGQNITWWLRLKGVRDIASGVAVLACMVWAGPRVVGIVLLALAIIPAGDMLLVLASKGSPRSAFGIHGFTTVLMLLAAIPLIMGG